MPTINYSTVFSGRDSKSPPAQSPTLSPQPLPGAKRSMAFETHCDPSIGCWRFLSLITRTLFERLTNLRKLLESEKPSAER